MLCTLGLWVDIRTRQLLSYAACENRCTYQAVDCPEKCFHQGLEQILPPEYMNW